ncbi:putative Histidine kinase [Syntrophobacter sp. SbD1]|nr:putative Histidine kinase [Syntrophobacter sp. SbD1]
MLRVLIVEDSEDDALLLLRELRRGGYEPVYERVETRESMKKALENGTWDIVVSDFILPGFSGLAALDVLKQSGLDLPFIIVSGKIGENTAVDAMKAGAHDYIMKESLKRLPPAVKRELREAETRRERKAAEEKLKSYTARLEIINQELQEFAFAASHDLREPLRKIQTFCDIISSRYAGDLDDKGRLYFGKMQETANRMSSMLDSLRNYSAAANCTSFSATDLTLLAKEAASNFEGIIRETGAAVETEELPVAEVDPDQIIRLFQNLIGNALKYRDDKAPKVRIYAVQSDCDTFGIYVEDNGIGFDECYIDKIFAPFQRLHDRTGGYEGTGMGLAMCRKIVERHGGSITARSQPGKGSVFIVKLPWKQPKKDEASICSGKQGVPPRRD